MLKSNLSLLIGITLGINGAQSQLIFTFKLEGAEFIEGEKVFCTLELENKSSAELDVPSLFPFFGGVYMELIDVRSGKPMKYTGAQVTMLAKERMKIKGNGKVLKMVELNTMYGKPFGVGSADQYIPSGPYKISASYGEGGDRKQSRSDAFVVSTPQGKDLVDYNFFLSIIREQRSSTASYQEAVEKILQLERESPRSGYVPIALSLAAAMYKFVLSDVAKANAIYLRLVEKYPEGVRMPGVLDAALSSIEDAAEQKAFIQRLIKASADSLGTTLLQQRLESQSKE